MASLRQFKTFYFQENCLSSITFQEMTEFLKLWQMKIKIGSYKD